MFDLESKPEEGRKATSNQQNKVHSEKLSIRRKATEISTWVLCALGKLFFLHPNWIHHIVGAATRVNMNLPLVQRDHYGHSVEGQAHPRPDPSLQRL